MVSELSGVRSRVDGIAHNQSLQPMSNRSPIPFCTPSSPIPSILRSIVTPEPPHKKPRQQLAVENSQMLTHMPTETVLVVGDTTISSLFYDWYSKRLYASSRSPDQAKRDIMNKLARMVCFCKCFLPDGTVLSIRPSPTNLQQSVDWTKIMRGYSVLVQDRIMKHITNHLPSSKRPRLPKVYSSVKACMSIDFDTYPTVTVSDKSLDEAVTVWGYADISCFKRC